MSELSVGGDRNWAESAPKLRSNLAILSPDQIELAKKLLNEGQSHVFANWPEPSIHDEEKRSLFHQVARLNANYPCGLVAYIRNTRTLLADSKSGKNPYDGFIPSVTSREVLSYGNETYMTFVEAGVREVRYAAFGLVACGLGERLGYKGIKVALALETTTGACFLQHYIESILALQNATCRLAQGECQVEIPLVRMTSDDTHARMVELLETNAYFGIKATQSQALKQEKVACLDDNDARLALDPQNGFKIQIKPPGHRDIHSLL